MSQWLSIHVPCTHFDVEISVPTRHSPCLHLLVHVVPVALHVSKAHIALWAAIQTAWTKRRERETETERGAATALIVPHRRWYMHVVSYVAIR